MLKRKIEKELENWKNTKYALMVYGARQVGKTYILNIFLQKNYDSVCYINLHENVDAIKTLLPSKDVDDFMLRLSFLSKEPFRDDTCFFIDEIQEYYTYIEKHPDIDSYFDILSETKYLTKYKQNRFVLSGSLLRLELNNLITNPVGYLLPLEMYPLDFEEFLWANHIDPRFITIAKDCFENKQPVPDYIHTKFIDLFKKYLLVGGMPQAVNEFVEKNNFADVENAHRAIEYYIQQDVTKYAEDNEKLRIREIYRLLPTELSNPSRKFIISHIQGASRTKDIEALSFSWLSSAGIAIPTYISSEPQIPLIASSKRNQLKLFHEDVGILTYIMFSHETKIKILNEEIVPNFGVIYENAVAQNLYAHGFSELYYYNSKAHGEVDFLLEKNSKVIPVEVKSGKKPVHRALNNILDIDNYNLDEAICFYNGNTKTEGKITYYPIYLCTFLYKR